MSDVRMDAERELGRVSDELQVVRQALWDAGEHEFAAEVAKLADELWQARKRSKARRL